MMLLRLGLAAFGGASMLTKLIAIGSIVLALGAAYGIWHHKVYSAGYARAINDIAAQDSLAIAAAKKGRSARQTCIDGGGSWDVVTGKCGRN